MKLGCDLQATCESSIRLILQRLITIPTKLVTFINLGGVILNYQKSTLQNSSSSIKACQVQAMWSWTLLYVHMFSILKWLVPHHIPWLLTEISLGICVSKMRFIISRHPRGQRAHYGSASCPSHLTQTPPSLSFLVSHFYEQLSFWVMMALNSAG